VSAPITWKELAGGARIEDFRIDNLPRRVKKVGDLWARLLEQNGRAKLESFYAGAD
jgi:DNA primase